MNKSPRDPETLKREFARRRARQWGVGGILLLGLIGIQGYILASAPETHRVEGGLLPYIILLLIIGIVVFSFLNWRCPACGSYLGSQYNPRVCHHCGASLQ
jgi:hypothetical protein